MEVDVAGLVVIQERDHARLAVVGAGHVGDQTGPQKLVDPFRHGTIGVAADPGPVGARAGGGGGGVRGGGVRGGAGGVRGGRVRRGAGFRRDLVGGRVIHDGSIAEQPGQA